MKTIDKSHFYLTLAKAWVPLLPRKVTFVELGAKEDFSKQERFVLEAMETTMLLAKHIDMLEFPKLYIQREKQPIKFKDTEMRDSYYRYHYENHVIRISSIFDYCLLLVNQIYELENPTKRVNYQLIIENENVSANTKSALKDLSIKILEIKAERNKIIHQGDYLNDKVIKIIDNNLHADLSTIPIHRDITKYFLSKKRIETKGLVNKMKEDVSSLTQGIIEVLDSMEKRIYLNKK